LVIGIFLAACGVAVLFNLQKLHSLAFHEKDFVYYLEFAAKLFDPSVTPRFSVNPEGYNVFRLMGTDGAVGLHDAIHLEPIKYVNAAVYRAVGHPVGLFVLSAVVIFGSMLYVVQAARSAERDGSGWFWVLWSLAVVGYPSTFFLASYDLRPYMFLGPLFAASYAAIRFERPRWEAAVFFNALFLVREEALVLGGILALWVCVGCLRGTADRGRAWLVAGSWLVWVLVYAWYFLFWTDFSWSPRMVRLTRESPFVAAVALVVGASGVTATFWVCARFRGIWSCVPLLAAGFVGIELLRSWSQMGNSLARSLLLDPRWTILGYLALVVLIGAPALRRARGVVTAAIVGVSLAVLGGSSGGLVAEWGRLRAREGEAGFVRDLARRVLDRHTDRVLTDFAAHQAFYDFEHVYVYSRLPTYIKTGSDRRYPMNRPALAQLMREVNAIVVTAGGECTMMELADEAGSALHVGERNGLFVVLVRHPATHRGPRELVCVPSPAGSSDTRAGAFRDQSGWRATPAEVRRRGSIDSRSHLS
jgi:hypothetical protein